MAELKKVRWGIMSTAKIGREKTIPAMQSSEFCDVVAIASRNKDQAELEASRLNIREVYSSYDDLLASDIDAVYIPLPNHLHVEWAKKAIEAGKHVLCEKPIGLSSFEAKELLKASQKRPDVKVMEAFMYHFHPQWKYVKKLVDDGVIGELKVIQSFFSYYNIDPNNIRNQVDVGGGGMMDIGCYCVSLSRFLFDKEPKRVLGIIEYDPDLLTDRIASGIMDFSTGTSLFTCSTQLTPFQRVNIIGEKARIEIEIPFNPEPDKISKIWIYSNADSKEVTFDPVNQYSVQADAFSKAILDNTDVPVNLEDAINNMKVIELIIESSKENRWLTI